MGRLEGRNPTSWDITRRLEVPTVETTVVGLIEREKGGGVTPAM